jgi:hypothetical protein
MRSITAALSRVSPQWFARWRWRKLVGRESSYTASISATGTHPGLAPANFARNFSRVSKDFFFILANGDSVNDLSKADLQFMRPYFSVGLNAWPLHPFVPSAFGFELWDLPDRHDSEFEFLVTMASEKRLNSGAPLWLLRPKPQQVGLLTAIMSKVQGINFDLYGRVNLPTRSPSRIDREIAKAFSFLEADDSSASVLLDNGSSVVRMICLALSHGFKNVILVGADLTDTPYFWYDENFVRVHGDFTQICRRQPDEGTDTLTTGDRPFGAQDFIYALARVAKDRFGAQILVASSRSALSPALEVFRFGRDTRA